jgi:hypothetical protein
MPNCCEICEHFLTPQKLLENARGVLEVGFGKRSVRLCRVHAFIAAQHKVTTLGGLQHLFRENRGRRSFLSRRTPGTEHGPRAEQRASAGRRASDLQTGA